MIFVKGKQYAKDELIALRAMIEKAANSLDETDALSCTNLFPEWKPGKQYNGGEYFTHGVNGVGDPQLYRVNDGKAHTSQSDWLPGTDATASLYTAIGLDDNGFPVWSAPTGAHDAYAAGDVVNHEGVLYQSTIDGNCIVPGTDDRYWTLYEA